MVSAIEELRPEDWDYPTSGLGRIKDILKPKGPIPISPSGWWEGVRTGRYPQPVKLGPKITAWRWREIRALAERGVA